MVKLNHRTSRTNILFWIRLLTFIYHGGGRGFSTVIKWCTYHWPSFGKLFNFESGCRGELTPKIDAYCNQIRIFIYLA